MESPAFSSFRYWMDLYDTYVEEETEDKIREFLDGGEFVMFLRMGSDVFGVSEEGRLIFANLKKPSDDLPVGWDMEATFTGHNLSRMLRGESGERVFFKNDLKKMKVIDTEEAKKLLDKSDIEEEPASPTITVINNKDAESPNKLQAER